MTAPTTRVAAPKVAGGTGGDAGGRNEERCCLIMVFTGDNDDMIRKNPIHQTMLLGNTARPMPRQISIQRLRFAGSVKGVPQYFTNHRIDLVENLFVIPSPLPVISESGFLKTNHNPAACSSAWWIACSRLSKDTRFLPCSALLIAFSKWQRLAMLNRAKIWFLLKAWNRQSNAPRNKRRDCD